MCDDQDAVAAGGKRCAMAGEQRGILQIADQHPRRERELDFRSVFVFVA
jgi:hypothetical protein